MNYTRKQVVDHYGLHQSTSDGVWWLMQQAGGQSAIGLPPSHCPFRMKTNLLVCPHEFNFKEALSDDDIRIQEYKSRMNDSEMLRVFDPVTPLQDAKCVYIETEYTNECYTLLLLQNMLSNQKTNLANPIRALVDLDTVARRLRSSNLASYIVYGFDQKNSARIKELTELSINIPGRLIIVGQRVSITEDSVMKKISFDAKQIRYVEQLGIQGMRAIGCTRLKQFMRV